MLFFSYSSKKANLRKKKLILHIENWNWKLKIAMFWQSSIKWPDNISKKSFKVAHLYAKVYWNSPTSLWNSTIIITLILGNLMTSKIPMYLRILKITIFSGLVEIKQHYYTCSFFKHWGYKSIKVFNVYLIQIDWSGSME